MGDFLAPHNACGQNLLRIVSRGNAILAELMRLKDYVPPVFRFDSKQFDQKYGSVIIDFAYFKACATYEQKIENDSALQALDEKLRENFSNILTRFYLAFESIHKYITDLNAYIDELEDGLYIQQSLESIMFNEEGKQLMCEAVYLYGIMLLLVDCHFEGYVRERLLVSYYRYNAQRSSSTRVDDVCMLLRSTGYSKSSLKRPANYPEEYFKRVPVNTSLVELVIGRLRSDELYNQSRAFPYPEHRSIALANQASMLVIILSFNPSLLHSQTAIMREIVVKFFPDCWVSSIYMGVVINLFDWWQPYKAARTALNSTLENSNIKKTAQNYGQKMDTQILEVEKIQFSVNLDENAVGPIVKLVRNCNVTLHWILLHTASPNMLVEESKRSKSIRQLVIHESKYSVENCLRLLLNTAQVEQNVKQFYKQLLQDKESKWMKKKERCVERISDLAELFSGNKFLDGTEKNLCLQKWFKEISEHVKTLQQDEGRKIVQLLQALEEVQEFHQPENNLNISQYLADTRVILRSMLLTGSISEDIMITLNIVTDCCYAWIIMESFVSVMQGCIKENPSMVIKLKALFLKMASALETPLLRINQARSADLSSVSQHYSRELEGFARRVLQIIPETVFGLLAEIVHLETNILKEMPTKISKDKLKDYEQFDDRLQMAKLTYAVSVFTKGELSLRSVSLGVLRVDSHRLFEDGIRQELVKKVTHALHNCLVFDLKSKTDLVKKLQNLATVMDGYRRSFQYIQDYININSLKIWHEEITYIINNAVEEECKGLTWIPGKNWRSLQDEKFIHIPVTDSNSYTFLGRFARELIRITDPRSTVYIEHTLAWYDIKTHNEVLNHNVFSTILQGMGTPGLCGLDELISFFTVVEIQNINNYLEKGVREKVWTDMIKDSNIIMQNNSENSKGNPGKLYMTALTGTTKIWMPMLDWVLKIGQFQILRNKIAYDLNTACKFEAKHMESALRTLNQAVLAEIYKRNNGYQTEGETELLRQLSIRLDWAGISDPQNKIYVKSKNVPDVEIIMFLFTVTQVHKLYYSKSIAGLLSKKVQDPVDAIAFAIGMQTVLRQFHTSALNRYVALLCEYIMLFVNVESSKTASDWEAEGITTLHFLELFAKYSNVPKSIILSHIPLVILDQYDVKLLK
ncbi:WASH complex subunit 5 [Cephus cinctus]|uniref:WASH complex subunit 5 n=1 Tax=Cephus cinctus TaxID=211228 RepID=A0AAJ7BP23_CEPCN|nr:WASH complex subunit 5 [Cephus cinctus]